MACSTRIMFDEKPLISSKKLFNWQLITFIVLSLIGLVSVIAGFYFLTTFSNESCIVEEAVPEASNSALLSFPRV